MKLSFMNQRLGRKSLKTFEEPVSFNRLYHKLVADGWDAEDWVLVAVEGLPVVVRAFFGNQLGWSLFDLQDDLKFACEVFEEWDDEELLARLIQVSSEQKIALDEFLWSGWRCVLDKDDRTALTDEFRTLDTKWKWSKIEGGAPIYDLTTFAKQHSDKVVELEDCYVILT